MLLIISGRIHQVVDGRLRPYESQFIAEKLEIAARAEKYSGWKHAEDDGPGGMVPRSMLWGGRRPKATAPEVTLARNHGDGFHFTVRMSRSSGLFYYDRKRDEEVRLFHKEGFNPMGLSADDAAIATTVDAEDGSRHIAIYDREGRNETVVTSGDSVDEHPFLSGGRIWYDARGIGRTQDGSVGGFGPRGLYAVDRDGGGHAVVRESRTWEYIMPKVAPDGTVYALRIPWESSDYTVWRSVKDVAMFPVVMGMAVIGFLNSFALMFAKKSIITHGGPRLPEQDIRKRLFHARMVDIERASREAGRRVAAPKSWKLVRLDGEADIEICAHVVDFDLHGAEVLVNTGFSVATADGRQLVATDELITGFSAPAG